MTRQPSPPRAFARAVPVRLTGLAAVVLVLSGCASLSPDGGFATVEKATAERIGTPVQLAWARQPEDLDRIAQRVDELLVAVGIGEVSAGQIARVLHELAQPKTVRPEQSAEPVRARRSRDDAIVIEGVGNLLSTTARCCQPVPGDPITGYLTRGRGVSIHRSNCASLSALLARAPERMIEVAWGDRGGAAYEVGIGVRAYDRKGLLKDVSSAIAAADAHVLAASTRLDADHGEPGLRRAAHAVGDRHDQGTGRQVRLQRQRRRQWRLHHHRHRHRLHRPRRHVRAGRDRCTRRPSFEQPGENFHPIGFLPLCDVA